MTERFRGVIQAVLILLSGVLLGFPAPLRAAQDDAPPAPPNLPAPSAAPNLIEPEALTVLQTMADAYKNLRGLSATVTFQAEGQETTAEMLWQRPGLLRVIHHLRDGGTRTVFANGNGVFITASARPMEYRALPAEHPDEMEENFASALRASELPFLGLVPFLLTSDDPRQTVLLPGTTELARESATTQDEVPVDVLRLRQGAGMFRFLIGKDDHLLRRIHVYAPGTEQPSAEEIYAEVQANPATPNRVFVYQPPPGARRIAEEVSPNATLPVIVTEPIYDARLRAGQKPPAASPELTNLLAKYRGRPVVVQFWAAWSEPSRQAVSDLQTLYKTFHPRGLEGIGISLDGLIGADEGKAAAAQFVTMQKIAWPQIIAGAGWESPAASAWKVGVVPLSVLIGPDGRVRAIATDSPETLRPQIEQALKKR